MKELDIFEFFHLCSLRSAKGSPPLEILPSTCGVAEAPAVCWHLHADAFAFPWLPQITVKGHKDTYAPKEQSRSICRLGKGFQVNLAFLVLFKNIYI